MKVVEDQSRSVAQSFGLIARDFDELFENQITRSIRQRVYKCIVDLVRQGSDILDINCGTGIDAMELARRGMHVTGIDIAPEMIDVAAAKRDGVKAPTFRVGSFLDLSAFSDSSFDIVFSNFGGLNCTGELSLVAREVERVLRPGGFFVATVMTRFSLWESASYLLRGDLAGALRRRLGSSDATGFGERSFKVFYHSLSALRSAFMSCSDFSSEGVSVFSPSPQSRQFVKRHPTLTLQLQRVDSVLVRLPLVRSWGDHVLIVLQKSS